MALKKKRGRAPASETSSALPRSSRSLKQLALIVTVVVAAGIAYSTSFKGVFVYDDGVAIVENPNIRSLWPLTSAMSAPVESPVSARPVASLSLAINYALAPADVRDVLKPGGPADPPGTTDRFRRNVWGYHAMNLMLHVCTALALAGVVRRTLLTERLRNAFGDVSSFLAFGVAAVWVVHPLTTDAVTYVAQRTEVLMGLCFWLTLYCSIRASDLALRSGTRTRWIAGAAIACAAGMASKQTMVTAPIVLWIWDWMFLASPESRRSRWPLYGALAATWLLLAALVAYERWPTSIGFALEGWTPWTYLLTQTTVIAHYVRLALLGGPLAVDYDGWPMSRSVLAVLPYALPRLTVFAIAVIGVIRRRAFAFPLVIFFAALAPSSSVLPLATEIAAERRMYVPLAGIVALAIIGAYALVRSWWPSRIAVRAAFLVTVGVVVVTYSSRTYARNRDFWSEEAIWADTVVKRPTNSRALVNYASTLAARGLDNEAEHLLRQAVSLKDTNAPAHLNLGSVLCRRGRLAECVQHLERALSVDPEYIAAYQNLGEAYGAMGNRPLAAKYFAMAVEAKPRDVFLLNRLGWLLATSPEDAVRNGAKAVEVALRAVELTGRRDPTSLDTLAAAYAEAGKFEDASASAGEAKQLAEDLNQREFAAEIVQRLAQYQMRQKFRERSR